MAKNPSVIKIESMFRGLNSISATNTLPSPGALSAILNNIADSTSGSSTTITQNHLSYFATAAVEMWHRAIHSFLISASLTKSSPIWSSVSGYYSSHYSIRAFAHLLGHFQLYRKKKNIEVEVIGQHYVCNIHPKGRDDREHVFYWKMVHNFFTNDPFFTTNNEKVEFSDSAHRNKANYFDHVDNFPQFQVLDEEYLRQRVLAISRVVINDVPIPNKNNDPFPDIDNVQLIAFYRLVKFKFFLNEILLDSSRFWLVHREPSWCPRYLKFEVATPEYLISYRESLMN